MHAVAGSRRSRSWRVRAAIIVAVVVIVGGCSAASQPRSESPSRSADGWQTATPEAHGFDSARLADALLAIRDKGLPVHSIVLVRDGELVLEAYFYPYDGSTVHELQSVTKSVTTTLVAIAADQGKLKLDDPMVSFFTDRTIANRDDRKDRITIRHLASMSSGLACTADADEQTLQDMKASADFVQFALDLPMAADPGSSFVYCSPGMHLLSAILQKATGMTELDFAREYLFKPLGITDAMWLSDPQGFSDGWADLYLRSPDAAKIGYLWASGGVWDGKQIVSRRWVEDSVKVQMTAAGGDDYGFGWWLPRSSTTHEYAAVGRGGQRIAVHPDLDLIVVLTAGGIEPSEVTDLLAPALVDQEQPLAPNPAGQDQLEATLNAIRRPPTAQEVPPLPAMAREISGKTWVFAPNVKNVKTARLDFDQPDTAAIEITFAGTEPTRAGRVGLDEVYRIGPGRNQLPSGFRGRWINPTVFEVDFDEIANQEAFVLRFRFETNRMTLEIKERSHAAGFTVVANPQR
jgi:CubicO group peptidase (beta-lactamase class C family)